jgi:hypothetical protein
LLRHPDPKVIVRLEPSWTAQTVVLCPPLGPVAARAQSPVIHRAMTLIAVETAIEPILVWDEIAFSLTGVDSLLLLFAGVEARLFSNRLIYT